MKCLVIVSIACLIRSSLSKDVQSKEDPCGSATTFNSLHKRFIGYEFFGDDLPLCDTYMNEGWYTFGKGNVLASSDENCGTVYNWYLNETLPSDDLVKYVLVCRNDGEGKNCSETKEIAVKKCGDNEYVFELPVLDGCPEAYCIESLDDSAVSDTPPDISTVKPVVDVVNVLLEEKYHLNFFCDFKPPKGTYYFYSVEWGIVTNHSLTHTLKRYGPLPYVSHFDFQRKTKLTEEILEDENFGHLGITIICSVTAQNTKSGSQSHAMESQPKFLGIEVQNKTIRVIKFEVITIFVRLTADFGCADDQNGICDMYVNVYFPNNEKSCRIPELSMITNNQDKCGIKISNQQINEWIPIRLSAFDGENRLPMTAHYTMVLSIQNNNTINPFFSNYTVEPIKLDVHTDMTLLKHKRCYSHNDPHMKAFDGRHYENQNRGKFLLYRNTQYETQVQIQTVECYRNIWCNCGVIVNAGRDVFIVNHCGRNRWDIRFRTCEDAILGRKVVKVHLSMYQVYLPTGTVVTIWIRGQLLNVDIVPGLSDFLKTEGLCGRFDGIGNNDRAKRPHSKFTDPNLSWRVLATEDLFNAHNDDYLKPWQEGLVLCSCNADGSMSSEEDNVTCHQDLAKVCPDDRINKNDFEHQCHKKINNHGVHAQKESDSHRTTETSFVSNSKDHTGQLFPTTSSQGMSYTDDTSREDCLDIFNTTVYTLCISLPGFEVNDYIDDCILDAKISNSMDWSMLHLEALKNKCLYEVKVNQPLSQDDLIDVDVIINNTVINFETKANYTVSFLDMPTFSKEVLNALKEMACPNECFGNGRCKGGVCSCNDNFIGEECSVNRKVAPIMEGIPDLGECDLQYRECNSTSVFASNLADTIGFTCQIVPFTISFKNEMIQSTQAITTKGQVFSIAEVFCPLQNSRRKRFAVNFQDDYIAKGYSISISNDGTEYSDEDIIVIFDSECVNCTKNNDEIVCKVKPGYCVKKGQCFRNGDISGCGVCKGENGTDNIHHWESGEDCPTFAPQSTESRSYWIIAAVICPVIVIIACIIGLVYYNRHNRRYSTTGMSFSLKLSMASKRNMYSFENTQ